MVNRSIYLLFKLQENILYKKYIKDIIKSFTKKFTVENNKFISCANKSLEAKMKETHGNPQEEFTLYIFNFWKKCTPQRICHNAPELLHQKWHYLWNTKKQNDKFWILLTLIRSSL